jgi:AcrR family transcriptional regulator
MPRATVLTKEVILNAAFEIVRKDGFGALSARSVARRLGCSVSPAYDTFGSMDGLKQEVAAKVQEEVDNLIYGYRKTGQPFFDLGLGYVYTAHTEPVLFRAFYSENMLGRKLDELPPNDHVLQALRQELGGLEVSEEKLANILTDAWIYVYGLASFIASGTLVYDEEKIMQRFACIWNNIVN